MYKYLGQSCSQNKVALKNKLKQKHKCIHTHSHTHTHIQTQSRIMAILSSRESFSGILTGTNIVRKEQVGIYRFLNGIFFSVFVLC